MKKTAILLLCSAFCAQLNAQKIKTAEQLELTNRGIYIGVATNFTRSGSDYLVSRSLLDAQCRFTDRFSAGLGLGFDYEKSTALITFTLTRIKLQPELRYWLHKEPQRVMPYLFVNYAWINERQTVPAPVNSITYWKTSVGAGCIGWLTKNVGLQIRGDFFFYNTDEISLTDSPLLSARIGVVVKTSK